MTVIMGVNLSDRVCLLADSRVSNIDAQSGEVTVKHDNMLKIEPLDDLSCCIIASAGDARFAQFLIRQMNRDFKDCDIVELRADIDTWARQQGDKYSAVDARSSVTFLIAGIDANSKQSIDRARVNTLLDAHFKDGPGFGTMRQVLADALTKEGPAGDRLSLDTNKTVLFSVKVDLQQGVTVTDAKWGQALISGPTRIEREDVSDADIARFEFEQANFTRLDQAVDHDSILMVALASTLARERSWLSVGGSFVPMHLYSNMKLVTLPRSIHSSDLNGENWEYISGYQMTSDTCYRIDERGTRYKMERVSKFKLDKRAGVDQDPKLQI